MSETPESLAELLKGMTPEIHANLKQAVELGRWESGERLTKDQVELCLQAVIAYDEQYLSRSERVAYIDRHKLKTRYCEE